MNKNTRNLLVYIGIPVILLLLFYFMSYKGKMEKMADLKNEISKLNVQLQQVEMNKRRINQLKQEKADLQLALEFAKEKLPSSNELTKLLDRINKLGTVESNISILHFQPKPLKRVGIYSEKPYELKIIGGFHQIMTFLNKIGNLDRIVNIDNIQLVPGKNNYEIANFVLKTYIYNEGASNNTSRRRRRR